MNEIWKDIYFTEKGIEYDFRGKFQVSNTGYIRDIDYKDSGEFRTMSARTDKCGYLHISLQGNSFLVHRLVAHMFLDGYFDGAYVDHIDTNRQNNIFNNLRWCTQEENMNNSLTLEKFKKGKKGKKGKKESYYFYQLHFYDEEKELADKLLNYSNSSGATIRAIFIKALMQYLKDKE